MKRSEKRLIAILVILVISYISTRIVLSVIHHYETTARAKREALIATFIHNNAHPILKESGAKKMSIFPPILRRTVKYAITDIGLGQANAINDRGEVVGVSGSNRDVNGDLYGKAFFWHHRKWHVLEIQKSHHSDAFSINNQGHIIGQSDFFQAFLWSKNRMQPLILGHPKKYYGLGKPISINNHGQIAFEGGVWRNGRFHLIGNFRFGPYHWNWDAIQSVAMNNNGKVHYRTDSREQA